MCGMMTLNDFLEPWGRFLSEVVLVFNAKLGAESEA